MSYDLALRAMLVDRWYAETITLDETRELRSYFREDIERVKRAGGPEKTLARLIMLDTAVSAKEYLAEMIASAKVADGG